MHLDLSSTNPVGVIDVRGVRSLSIQSRLVSGATTAVVEVKQAFSPYLNTPSASLSTTTTLTLDGSAITQIDVTNIGYIHLEVTTADAGAAAEIAYKTTGQVFGEVFVVSLNGDYEVAQNVLVSRGYSMAYMLADPVGSVSTGAFRIQRALDEGFTPVDHSPSVTLSLDGSTVTSVDVSSSPLIVPVCTTAQSGLRGDLYVYARRAVEQDANSGTAFPFPAVDGQAFTRTDLEGETFHWDATRGKWLGELLCIYASRASSYSSGDFPLQNGPTAFHTDGRGLAFDHDITIVGADCLSRSSFSGGIKWWEKTTEQTTLLTVTSAVAGSDMTLNYDVPGDLTKAPFPRGFATAGSFDQPMCRVYYRRKAT